MGQALTQNQRILEFIKAHGSITPMDAFEMGITRLAACVFEMRRRGIDIVTETVETVNRYGDKVRFARYRVNGGVPECFSA